VIAKVDARQVVVVDECGTHRGMTPAYARAPRGERAHATTLRNYGSNVSLIAAMTLQGMGPAMSLEGSVDTTAFETYIQHCLLPMLQPGQIILMDNLSSHKGARVQALLEAHGCAVLFLPAYSPDLTPIEEAFSKIKNNLRRAAALSLDALQDAIAAALLTISISDAYGFFQHAGFNLLAQSL
jgi:transposase